jgi:hypothetical protein
MSEPEASSLAAVVESAAAELEATERRTTADGAEWSIGGITFAAVAAVAAERAEFRLARPVVEAALRTPGTARSRRGADWVAFQPPELDQHAIDRATAWLASAWRRADGES